jgi:hypothetical protein
MRQSAGRTRGERRRFRPGAVVEVKSAEEILATLDQDGAVNALPFMPEMLRFAGRRFTISSRAEQSCDTIHTARSRRMRDAVHLDDLRCDGSAHGGCQAGCLLYWKESWLKPVPDREGGPAEMPVPPPAVPSLLAGATLQPSDPQDPAPTVRYRCQATEMFRATEPLRLWDVRRYLRELQVGNVSPGRFMRVLSRAAVRAVAVRARLRSRMPVDGRCVGPTPKGELDLRPGEWVRVKRREQVAETLNAKGKNRGLWFDWEMLPHCGRTYRVQDRVRRIVDERTGELIEFGSDSLILEGVICSGDHSSRRLFCPRAIYPYWREAWLERAPAPTTAAQGAEEGS